MPHMVAARPLRTAVGHGNTDTQEGDSTMTHRMTTEEAEKARGCWLEGSRGWTASGELVNIADHHGMPLDDDDRAIVGHYLARGEDDLTLSTGQVIKADDVHGLVVDQGELSSKAETYLNEHVAPEGWSFGWNDGEFYLWPDSEWEKNC